VVKALLYALEDLILLPSTNVSAVAGRAQTSEEIAWTKKSRAHPALS